MARNMPEALQQVRDDLGENAVILNTRQIRRNNRFNLDDEVRVEVTAAFDEGGVARTAAPPSKAAAASDGSPASAPVQRGVPPRASLAAQKYTSPPLSPPSRPLVDAQREPSRQFPAPAETAPLAPPAAVPSGDVASLLKQLQELQKTVARMERRAPAAGIVLPPTLARLAERMRSRGVDSGLADPLVQQLVEKLGGKTLEDGARVKQRAAALLSGRLPGCKDIKIGRRRKIVGFFGPAGAGKTTAAAKIAAGFAMKRRESILLISADDKRVGALDQARAFAQIIGVPLEVAYTEEEITTVMERHAEAKLVLIDPSGCGPHDHSEKERQRRLFAAAGADEVQVVIDGMSSLDHMLDVIEASELFGERRLLFTKMDAVVRSGAVLSAAAHSQVPTSYFIVGAAVPGQIEAGSLARLANEMIGVATVPKKKGR